VKISLTVNGAPITREVEGRQTLVVAHVETPTRYSEGGFKGAGEGGARARRAPCSTWSTTRSARSRRASPACR
jgi:hypothetical protein